MNFAENRSTRTHFGHLRRVSMTVPSASVWYTGSRDDGMAAANGHVCACGDDDDDAPDDVATASVCAAVHPRGEAGVEDEDDDDEAAARNGQETLVVVWERGEEGSFFEASPCAWLMDRVRAEGVSICMFACMFVSLFLLFWAARVLRSFPCLSGSMRLDINAFLAALLVRLKTHESKNRV